MKGFAIYKKSLDSILENSYGNKKEFKKNLSIIMGALKYSTTLKEFFTLYNEIENKNYNDIKEGEKYLTEAINYLKTQKKELQKVTPILDKIIEKRKDLLEDTHNPHYNNLDTIIFSTSIKNLETII